MGIDDIIANIGDNTFFTSYVGGEYKIWVEGGQFMTIINPNKEITSTLNRLRVERFSRYQVLKDILKKIEVLGSEVILQIPIMNGAIDRILSIAKISLSLVKEEIEKWLESLSIVAPIKIKRCTSFEHLKA